MDKLSFSSFDNRLNATTAPEARLQAILGTEGASLLVTDAQRLPLALSTWQFSPAHPDFEAALSDLRMVMGREVMFGWPFGQVQFALSNAQVTLVPRRLFRDQALSAYFHLLLPEKPLHYAYELLPELDCFLVYAVEQSAIDLIRQYYPAAAITHLAYPLLEQWRREASATDYSIMANLRQESVQIAVFERRNLLFYNTFSWKTPADLLYHMLLVYEQFRLNPLEVGLQLSGNLVEASDIYRQLYRYIRHLRFVSLPAGLRMPAQSDGLPPHCFYDTYTLCAL
jgi:hypothetical protein